MAASVTNIPAQAKLRVERARSRYGLVDIVVRVLKRYSEDDGGSYAAALTYYTFFSIFPLLLFAFSIIGFLSSNNDELRRQLTDAGVDAFPMLRDILQPQGLEFFEHQRTQLALTGTLLALYAGSGAVVALEHALNKVNRVVHEPGFLPKRLRSLAWLAILGAGAVLSLGFGFLFQYAGTLFDSLGPGQKVLAFGLGHLGGFLVGILIFATAFRFLPATEAGWRDVLPGAIVASFAFEILKEFGAWYLDRGAVGREATFGAFATAAGLLVASYLVAQIVLMSAEVNAVLAERRATRSSAGTIDQGGTSG